MLNKILITMFIGSLAISGCTTQEDTYVHKAARPIHELIDNRAPLAIAIGETENSTGQPIVINALTAKEQSPCSTIIVENTNQDYSQKEQQPKEQSSGCEPTLVNQSLELLEAKRLTGVPISGTIIKDGKEISVTFYRVLIAAYAGSYCSTTFSAGKEYQECVSEQQTCESKRQDVSFVSLAQFLIWEPQCKGLVTQ